MSIGIDGIVHGVTSVIFECPDCGVRYESRNGVGLAAKHWHKTGHHIVGEVVVGWSFPKGYGIHNASRGTVQEVKEG